MSWSCRMTDFGWLENEWMIFVSFSVLYTPKVVNVFPDYQPEPWLWTIHIQKTPHILYLMGIYNQMERRVKPHMRNHKNGNQVKIMGHRLWMLKAFKDCEVCSLIQCTCHFIPDPKEKVEQIKKWEKRVRPLKQKESQDQSRIGREARVFEPFWVLIHCQLS